MRCSSAARWRTPSSRRAACRSASRWSKRICWTPRATVEQQAKARDLRFELPVDHVVAPKLEAGAPAETLDVGDAAIGDRMGLDIGPKTDRAVSRRSSPARRPSPGTGRWGCSRSTPSRRARSRSPRRWRTVDGHDRHRRRRLDRRRRQGRRDRSHHAHLDRRRRLARVSRRAEAAGGGCAKLVLPAPAPAPARALRSAAPAGNWLVAGSW